MILSWITVKDNEDGSTQLIDSHFHTEVARNLERLTKRKSSVNTILERLQTYNREGSNRRFQRVTSLKIQINRYKPLGGLSYIKFLVRLRRRRQSWTSRTRMKSAFDGKFSGTSTQSSRTLRGSKAWEKRLSLIEKCYSHSNRLKIQIIRFGSNEMPRETDNCSFQTQSRWFKLAVGLFITVLRLCWATPPDDHSFCQAVCGNVPKCSQWQFRDSAKANLRQILSLPGTVS